MFCPTHAYSMEGLILEACLHLVVDSGLMWIDHVRTIHTIPVTVD